MTKETGLLVVDIVLGVIFLHLLLRHIKLSNAVRAVLVLFIVFLYADQPGGWPKLLLLKAEVAAAKWDHWAR